MPPALQLSGGTKEGPACLLALNMPLASCVSSGTRGAHSMATSCMLLLICERNAGFVFTNKL